MSKRQSQSQNMPTDESIVTEDAFQQRLRELVTEAAGNGVDVEGSWPVLHDDPDAAEWDIEIVALAKSN